MARVAGSQSSGSFFVLLFGAVLVALVFAKVVFIPLAFALTLSFLLVPAVALLERWHIRRSLAVLVVSGGACACLAAGAYVISIQIISVAQTLPAYRANLQRHITTLHSSSEGSIEAAVGMIEDLSRDLAYGTAPAQREAVPVQVVGHRSDQLQATVGVVGSFLQPIAQFGIVIVFTIYMLINREDLRHRLLLLTGMGNINVMTQALEDASARISRYLLSQLQVNACYATVFGSGLYLLHVPQATLWGVIAGSLRIVPFVGTFIGLIPPLALSLATSSNWWNPALVLALFLVIEATLANLVEPLLFSSRTGISSLALLISAIFWSMLWGFPGLVLATPLTVCMVVLGRHVPQLSFLHSLLGTNATLSPPARLYERLLAMDQAGAWRVAEAYLQSKPLADLYDSVILPVLSLAEEERYKGVLDEVHWNFILLSVGEMIARLAEYQPSRSLDGTKSRRRIPRDREGVFREDEFAVVCIATGGKADALATSMLTQLLERADFQTLMLATDALSPEVLRGLAAETSTVIFLSALPPFAFAQARALCHRVRGQLSANRVAIGLWTSTEDGEEMLPRFGAARPEVVVGTLRHAISQAETWRRATHRARA